MNYLRKLTTEQKVKYLSFGTGGTLLLLGFIAFIAGSTVLGGALLVSGLIAGGVPFSLYSYFQTKKFQALEEEFPVFLRSLSESIKSGMSLPQAFQNATKTDYGRLNPYIQKAADQISWGIPFPEVMERLQNKMQTSSLITRSIAILMQSYESGGNISETMDSIARDATKIKDAEKERQSVLYKQVMIIYVIYFLFLGILIALFKILVPLLNIEGGEFLQPPPNFCTDIAIARPICSLCPTLGFGSHTDKFCYYKSIFLLMLIVEGIFNGMVAGEIEAGKVSAGVKHILIMVPIGVIAYIFLLNILG